MDLSLDAFIVLKENLPDDLIKVIIDFSNDETLHIDTFELTIRSIFENARINYKENTYFTKERTDFDKNLVFNIIAKEIVYYEQEKMA